MCLKYLRATAGSINCWLGLCFIAALTADFEEPLDLFWANHPANHRFVLCLLELM